MLLDTLQTIFVFQPKPGCRLNTSDLLVYSYLSKRQSYGDKDNIKSVSHATGLCRETVSSSFDRLTELGFLSEKQPVSQNDQFFGRGSAGHWSKRIQFFKCLCKSEDSPLSVIETTLFSRLLNWHLSNKFPNKLKDQYIANAICCDKRTVGPALETLTKRQLYRKEGNDHLVPEYLTGQQLMWFMPKLEPSDDTGKESIRTFAPEPELIIDHDMVRAEPDQPLRRPEQPVTMRDDTRELIGLLINQLNGEYPKEQYGRYIETIRKAQPSCDTPQKRSAILQTVRRHLRSGHQGTSESPLRPDGEAQDRPVV